MENPIVVGVGIVLLIVISLYFLCRMPKCPVCEKRKHISFYEYGGYYCTKCDSYFGAEEWY